MLPRPTSLARRVEEEEGLARHPRTGLFPCVCPQELDYKLEAENARRFRELFGSDKDLYCPHIYTELSSSRVLVMEWIEGERLRSVSDGLGPGNPQARDPMGHAFQFGLRAGWICRVSDR